ncbi:hypothetical protein PQBR44_0184 (plasmid) [Pseudomonas putida UWC1]|nr:hypothetical protein PQBR44_0184 [Pseudomonas putida UWC1]
MRHLHPPDETVTTQSLIRWIPTKQSMHLMAIKDTFETDDRIVK